MDVQQLKIKKSNVLIPNYIDDMYHEKRKIFLPKCKTMALFRILIVCVNFAYKNIHLYMNYKVDFNAL